MRNTISNSTNSSEAMKSVLEPLKREGLIFKRFEPFSLQTVGSRKKIGVYHGIDLQNRYVLLFVVERKSRILQKDVKEWFELKEKIENHFGYKILRNIALVRAPICSKAKALLERGNWKVIVE